MLTTIPRKNSRPLFLALLLSTSAAPAFLPMTAHAESDVVTDVAPPPPRKENAPHPPAGSVWNPGHWEWTGHSYVWLSGNWVAERRGAHWITGQWEQVGAQWHYTHGHWEH